MESKKPKNLIKNFLEHISEKSSNVLKKKITPKIDNGCKHTRTKSKTSTKNFYCLTKNFNCFM